MERKTFFCNLGLYIKSVLVFILLLGGSGSAWADELTVTSTTSKTYTANAPLAGNLLNGTLAKCEYIIPASKITALRGKEITKISLTLNAATTGWGDAEFTVFLKEVTNSEYPNPVVLVGTTGATTVYQGTLDATKTKIDIAFTNNFTYTVSSTNNLLIGIYCTKIGDAADVNFKLIRENSDDYNYYSGYTNNANGSMTRTNWYPETTFTYQDPASSGIPKPTYFSASDVTYNSAILSWKENGEATKWQIKYKTDSDFANLNSSEGESIIVNATDGGYSVSEGVSSYTFTPPYDGKTYYAYIRAYIDEDTQSDWSSGINFAIPEQYPTPTGLTASNYAGDGDKATLRWTDGAGTTPESWKLRYHTADFNPANNEGTLVEEDIESNSYTLTGLTSGQVYYVSVQACYVGGNESNWTSTISFTPIQAWETFESGIPSSWYNQDNNWKTNQSGYVGKAYSPTSGKELRTPRLYATEGQTINYEVTGSPSIKVYKNNSRNSYTSLTSGTTSYTAPSTGYYWLGFTGYNVAIDNIYGFSLASTENLLELGKKNMPTSGTIGGTYTASVEVRELGGNDESFDAELYYDDEKVAEKTSQAISANRDVTVQLSFTPIEEKASKKMYIKIIYNDGESELTTASTEVTMSKTPHILDETGATDNAPSGSLSGGVVWLKYTPRNGWNTICIPFVLTDEHLERIFGTGYEIFKIKSYENGTLTFQKAPSRGASTPYLVYATNANNVDKDNIFLEQSYIGSSNYTSGNMTQQSVFKGIWTTKTYNNDDWYGVTTAGQIRKAASGASVKGYHAYFTGVSAPTGGDARITIVFEDEEGTTTDLGFVKMVDPEAEHIYTLSGQKVQKGKKGIYIVNGRKVVIK